MSFQRLLEILPEYPRTVHLPWKPNATRQDLIASEADCQILFQSPNVFIEEKVDAANCGMAWIENEPVIRNRNHILRKSFHAKTPAKMQFASVWNWFYQNKERFEQLPDSVSVYGEWMYAVHGIKYTTLPDLFMAYDLYDYEAHKFLHPALARTYLINAGFQVVPLLHQGPIKNWQELEQLTYEKSPFADEMREGIYLKVSDGQYITHRFKMVRQGFIQGEHWTKTALKRNGLKLEEK